MATIEGYTTAKYSRDFYVAWMLFFAGFLLTRSPQIEEFQGVAAYFLIAIVAVCFKLPGVLIIFPVVGYLIISSLVSTFFGGDINHIVRFSAITVFTVATFLTFKFDIRRNFVLIPFFIQGLIVILIATMLYFLRETEAPKLLRYYFLEKKWGDVYSLDGMWFKVQLLGNALLPLCFFLSLWSRDRFLSTYGSVFFGLAVLAAGNFTYIIVLLLSLMIRFRGMLYRSIPQKVTLLSIIFAYLYFIPENPFINALMLKYEGQSVSVRFEQLKIFWENVTYSPFSLAFGGGVGAYFYPHNSDDQAALYIELQSLMLVHKLGLLGFGLYVATLYFSARRALSKTGLLIYFLFMVCGITNPYILDSNQILAGLLCKGFYGRGNQS